ncbi:hypothetical protein Clacol_001426 [Clathrus columnatus]|uniref:Fumarylacetoacetase-like C-terminal domain-containing protein n=1 Tax=Clathrus columnatus TaxID=1419009 RepID=A0AAV5A2I0_9AGAM|nr:hypothetical protein Clacol_001426 [Clathrus columnatus]
MTWTRLIRFIAVETKRIHLGQPVDPNLDVGLAYHKKNTIKAHEIIGSALDPNAKVTTKVLTVGTLLEPLEREEVKLVRCLGLNYADHAVRLIFLPPLETAKADFVPVASLIAPGAPIVIPYVAQPVQEHIPDYEVELTIVIGKTAKDVPESEALDYVLGYTVGNDISFRKHQMTTSQWTFSKSFDDTTPFGPVIVNAKAIPDPQNLPLKTILNGKVLQDGSTRDQIFNVKQTIAFLSQGTTLTPGTIIMTGTPAGVGFVRKPTVYLKDGDIISVYIGGGIGSLINPVIEEPKARL